MPKCIICDGKAEFCIKGSSEYYCKDCAKECFNDVSCLQKAEEQANALKNAIDQE